MPRCAYPRGIHGISLTGKAAAWYEGLLQVGRHGEQRHFLLGDPIAAQRPAREMANEISVSLQSYFYFAEGQGKGLGIAHVERNCSWVRSTSPSLRLLMKAAME